MHRNSLQEEETAAHKSFNSLDNRKSNRSRKVSPFWHENFFIIQFFPSQTHRIDISSIKSLKFPLSNRLHMSGVSHKKWVTSHWIIKCENILTKHFGDREQQSQTEAASYRCGWCCSWRSCLRWIGIPFSHDLQFTFAFSFVLSEFVALNCTHGIISYCTTMLRFRFLFEWLRFCEFRERKRKILGQIESFVTVLGAIRWEICEK